MNEAKIKRKVEIIFNAWGLMDLPINVEKIEDIKSAIREAYIKGFKKGFC